MSVMSQGRAAELGYARPNAAGSRFPMQGGTLSQLSQPTAPFQYGHGRMAGSINGQLQDTGAAQMPGMVGGPNMSTVTPSPATMPGQQVIPPTPMAGPAGGPPMQDRGEWLRNTPGYQFRMEEGQRALERSAAARGTSLTGGTLKDLAQFSQGLASTEFGNEADRLARLTQLGQSGAQQLGNYGTGYGAMNAGLAEVGGANDIALGNAQGRSTLAGANVANGAGSAVAGVLGGIDWGSIFRGQPKPNLNQFLQSGNGIPMGPGTLSQLGAPPPYAYAQNFQAPRPGGVNG